MTKESKQIFTERITSANRTELIVVLFDIWFSYLGDAYENLDNDDTETFKENILKAEKVLIHLKSDLDFQFEMSKNLYALYDYCQRKLTASIYNKSKENLDEIKKIMTSLKDAFFQISEKDSSKPIMQNAEKVVYGITYGKTDVNTNVAMTDVSRGFRA
ncbi:MAG: flagellar protein FliS [Lachnospiraceae bacterium]|nr:flagellar protein FliS [Lachnospiraceae bacterium]